jgi:hypothetical protein
MLHARSGNTNVIRPILAALWFVVDLHFPIEHTDESRQALLVKLNAGRVFTLACRQCQSYRLVTDHGIASLVVSFGICLMLKDPAL